MARSFVAKLALGAVLSTLAAQPLRSDVFKDLLKGLENSAKQELQRQVEAVRTEAATSAQVASFDYTLRPSLLVRTSDGRRFQLRALNFAASRDLTSPLAMATRADFRYLGGQTYDVSFALRSIQPVSGSFVAGVLAGAANDYAEKNLSRVRSDISALLGRALDGSDWVLPLDNCRIDSIEVLEGETTPPPAMEVAKAEAPTSHSEEAPPAPRQAPTPAAPPAPTPGPPPAVDEVPRPAAHVDPAPTQVAAPPPVLLPRARLRSVDGSFATCNVDPGFDLKSGMTVVVIRGGTRVGKAIVIDRRTGEADLEITESFAGRDPQVGDLIRVEGR
ncbi:MAG: hypothetical protein KBF21_06570 [Thermoanaerobaculia bacterium]|nr:hypothetical protein [Thermoanaerobaculia bacterium]MBP9823870.1 hypothetical protein [Thermoanaerobaculia bacterium]